MLQRLLLSLVMVATLTLSLAVPSPTVRADDSSQTADDLSGTWNWISFTSTRPGRDPSVSILSGELHLNADGSFDELFKSGSFLNSGAGTYSQSGDRLLLTFSPEYGLDPATYTVARGPLADGSRTYDALSLRQDYPDGSTALYLLFRQ